MNIEQRYIRRVVTVYGGGMEMNMTVCDTLYCAVRPSDPRAYVRANQAARRYRK